MARQLTMTTDASEAAPEEWTIVESGSKDTPAGVDCYLLKESPTGEREFHGFPMEALEWRAAEYGIDPNDFDALVDIIVHEAYVPDPAEPANVLADAAAAAGFVSPAVELRSGMTALELMPTTLLSAETTEEAREAHLKRIEHAKKTRARVTRASGKRDPCLGLREAYAAFVDEAEVEAKRQAVQAKRRELQASAQRRAKNGETGGMRRRRRLDRRINLEGQAL